MNALGENSRQMENFQGSHIIVGLTIARFLVSMDHENNKHNLLVL